MALTGDKRGYTAGKYGIDLDGINAGWVSSVEGGMASSDVVVEKLGPDHIQRKHIAGVKYEDISVSCGTGMSKEFYNWVKASFDHQYARKNGAIHTADANFKAVSRLDFFDALVTEIGFPALDAGSKDAAKMTIKFSPERTRFAKGDNNAVGGPANSKVQKQWLPSNFKLTIDNLDCTQVNKIEAITLKQKVVENPVGELRDYQREPASLEVPNLVVTFTEAIADPWYKWHEDFVIKGLNGDDKEKGGSLVYLTPDMKELFTITFEHLGIFKLTPEKVEAGSENIRRVKAEMYCEDMKFNYAGSATWA